MEKITVLAHKIYASQPLLKGFQDSLENKLHVLSNTEKIDLLVYCFKNYDKGFNISLILSCPDIWKNFILKDWALLISKMFPRKEFDKHSFKDINSVSYCDILILNGIIGINPFRYIFDNEQFTIEEKKLLFDFFKHRGEYTFYINERELIEDIVHFYDLEVFQEIVIMKEKLLLEGLTPTVKYQEIMKQYSFLEIL
ncbi:hypothetical protein C8C83_5081 [Flavobacterium sp. 90]|uniref:hypothetical protein n=1 Tax=unclassified Flavobacterium TaxID=196869 RepID=UPI000EB5A2BE|nr:MULTISPECIES: hypothetical protein [unclassified Flavobacterium]RKR05731.1 hypothetical protein C8C82_5427 [Flavobacterium sp. 81]TCK57042.1 hypothetical protein C8C83_5081 [Flavobacterium sp. 90]